MTGNFRECHFTKAGQHFRGRDLENGLNGGDRSDCFAIRLIELTIIQRNPEIVLKWCKTQTGVGHHE